MLSQSDGWRHRVKAEAEHVINSSIIDLAERLPETRAVIEEADQLYPPIAAISRAAIDADELFGQTITREDDGGYFTLRPPPASVVIVGSRSLRPWSISR